MAENGWDQVWAAPQDGPGRGVAPSGVPAQGGPARWPAGQPWAGQRRPARPGRRAAAVCLAVAAAGVVAAVLGAALLVTGYHRYTMGGASMQPTLHAGDRVWVRRISTSEVRRGDVVALSVPAWGWGRQLVVKRVVGVGGDRVSARADGRLTVNGRAVEEPYTASSGQFSGPPFAVTVPRGRFFVMGDNRENSNDSRYHLEDGMGGVAAADVRGCVERVEDVSGFHALVPTRAFADAGVGPAAGPGPFRAYVTVLGSGVVAAFTGLAALPVSLWTTRRRARSRAAGIPGSVAA
ncbi:signal peptidase I [Streptomyces sp. NPDC001380]|uniref:signal peptidase I n=1 Tax=Streptomyces sp. NPDC001380 TaxID=3364566 RepID=UPI0036C06DE2